MPGTVQTMFQALGTVNTITLSKNAEKCVAEAARTFIRGLDRSLSVFRPESEISRFNALRGGEWMAVSEDTFSIFQESVRCGDLTDGAFDITAGPLSSLWREAIRSEKLLSASDIHRVKRLVNYRDLRLNTDKKQVCLRNRKQSVDFGGIAKGYAADKVTFLLRNADVQDSVINLGGTVGVTGKARRIGIQDPLRPTGEPLGTLTLENTFAVTSGSYEHGFTEEGVRYHHIIDPRTGMPSSSGLLSVTLIGTRAVELDAFATAAFILGAAGILPLLMRRSIEAVFIFETGEVLVTPGLRSDFQLLSRKGA